jgi:hypothetical protein
MNTIPKLCLVGLVVGILAAGWAAADDKGVSTVNFKVLRDSSGKPIRNASVILHPVNDKGKQEKGGLQLKTDAEGKTNFAGVPYGKLRIQVIAQGFQTFGEDYDINKPDMDIVIRMKRPAEQYSIYGNKKPDESKPEDKPQ